MDTRKHELHNDTIINNGSIVDTKLLEIINGTKP